MGYSIKRKQCGHLRCGSVCRFAKEKKKPYYLPKFSKKREEENKLYFPMVEQFLKEHPVCQCGRIVYNPKTQKREICGRKATEVHHSKGRVGKNFLDVDTWRAMARSCHLWAELNTIEAKKIGVSQKRLT